MTDPLPHGLGALPTPPELLAKAWPIELALMSIGIAAPTKYHSPKCQPITIDQDGVGACVTFSGAYVQADQELADEGKQLNPKVLDPLRTYFEVKGIPYQGWGTPDPNPGLYPPQLFDYTKATGWATLDGSPRRKDAAYYSLGKLSSGAAFLDAYQQTVLQLGPAMFTAAWPTNWFSTDLHGFMMPPSSTTNGGHAFEACGWEVFPNGCPILPGCMWDSFHHQSWGTFGHDPEFPNHFRVHSPWWDRLGWEAWRVFDVTGDAPIPPPEAGMLPAYSVDPKLLDLAIGTQLYREDGKTALVKVSSGGAGLFSPGLAYATQRAVVISTGGVKQYAVANLADCKNLRPYSSPHQVKVTAEVDAQPAGAPIEFTV